MEFHDDYPQYEIMANHTEAEGGPIRKQLWKVFFIMLAITIVELVVGFKAAEWGIAGTTALKLFFILFTIAKAYFIVFSFMHLGHENKPSKWVILAPYITFVLYLIYLTSVDEGTYSMKHRYSMDKNIIEQSAKEHAHASAASAGQHEGATEEHHSETEGK